MQSRRSDEVSNASAILALVIVTAGSLPLLGQDLPQAETDQGFTKALTDGELGLDFRYRYEFVDQDFNRLTGEPFNNNAHASTIKLRLNYQTGTWRQWTAFGEFDYVAELLLDEFNSGGGTSPGREEYPVVADPWGADLNQLYLDYAGFDKTTLRFGRQRMRLDNQRFVGSAPWRQNEQTFDAFSVVSDALSRTQLTYAYVARVNRVLGERSPFGRETTNTHLLNANITLAQNWRLVPYAYLIDNDDVAARSTHTFGARFEGNVDLGDSKLALLAEVATQSDAGNNPVSYSATYYHLRADWALNTAWTLAAGFESLGGDNAETGAAFRTPMGALHGFQGWADQFLVTPDAGVDDLYLSASYKAGKWAFAAIYHDFSAQSGSGNWGQEFDVSAARSLVIDFRCWSRRPCSPPMTRRFPMSANSGLC